MKKIIPIVVVGVVAVVFLVLWRLGVFMPDYPDDGLYILKTNSFHAFYDDEDVVLYIPCIEIAGEGNKKDFFDNYSNFAMVSVDGNEYPADVDYYLVYRGEKYLESTLALQIADIQETIIQFDKIRYFDIDSNKVVERDIGLIQAKVVSSENRNFLFSACGGFITTGTEPAHYELVNNYDVPITITDIVYFTDVGRMGQITNDAGKVDFPIVLYPDEKLSVAIPANIDEDVFSVFISPVVHFTMDGQEYTNIVKQFVGFNLFRMTDDDLIVDIIDKVYGGESD